MNKNDILHTLFKTLTDILPYEYGEHLTKDTEYIAITKKDSPIVVYIAENKTEPGTLDATSYDTEEDELSPDITVHLDIMDPDFNIIDAINEIKQLF
ncbi:MAG: hypothetical protein [Namikivirus ikeda]|uniref:Uncharacterized protein n=1 Tax=Bacteriophage sp. TaxID=38018 RepID=A0ABY5TTE1_9VIRU|nr:MAG: hypothetical protein [Bacteriophage sp.]